MSTLIHERVELAKRGLSPHVIGRVRSGWAVLGDSQFITGYSLLLPDPVVPSLNALAPDQRAQFLLDMTAIGDALLATTDAYRINYEILFEIFWKQKAALSGLLTGSSAHFGGGCVAPWCA